MSSIGLITYMRTDSVRVSNEAQENTKISLQLIFGDKYLPQNKRVYKGKKNTQDAHEAIRPTNIEITPEIAKENLKNPQYKLYSLIWNRFVASQMASCILDSTSIEINNGEYSLKATGSTVKFDGFHKNL